MECIVLGMQRLISSSDLIPEESGTPDDEASQIVDIVNREFPAKQIRRGSAPQALGMLQSESFSHQSMIEKLSEFCRKQAVFIEDTKSDVDAQPTTCSEQEFKDAVVNLDSINKKIQRAQEWPAFIERQKKAAAEIESIDAKLASIDESIDSIRKARSSVISSSISVVEEEANKLIGKMGLPPMKLAVSVSGKRSALTIVNSEGTELVALCGAERVVYQLAMLIAIHNLSKCKSPIRLVEAAELDSDSLSKLIVALNDIPTKGTTVIATHVNPSPLPCVECNFVYC